MSSVWVNGKHVDFLQAAYVRHKVSPGCRAFEERQERKKEEKKAKAKAKEAKANNEIGDPCEGVNCNNGKCLPRQGGTGGKGYTCNCMPGYSGRHCTIQSKSRFPVPFRSIFFFTWKGKKRKEPLA